MKFVVEAASLECGHAGRVQHVASNSWIRITESPLMVRSDVEDVSIAGCPNTNPGQSVCCSKTLRVQGQSHSKWISIEGDPVCIQSVWGFTECQPKLSSTYFIASPGQQLVTELT